MRAPARGRPARGPGRSRTAAVILGLCLLGGTALRLRWHNVEAFSPADETVYVATANAFLHGGWGRFRELVGAYVDDPQRWNSPPPTRIGYFALTTGAGRLTGRCDFRTLAWLSTLAGVAALAGTYAVGRAVLGAEAGVLAVALSIASPLQLAMGRRALTDELFCALWLAVLYALLKGLRDPDGVLRHRVAAALLLTYACLMRESATMYCAVAGLVIVAVRLVQRRRPRPADLAIALTPPLAAAVILCGFGGIDRIVRLARVIAPPDLPYNLTLQGGPPHRILVDFMMLTPAMITLALGAVVMTVAGRARRDAGWTGLVAGFAAILVVLGLFPSKNVRYAIGADPLARLLAAGVLWDALGARRTARGLLVLTLVTAACVAADYGVFKTVFIAGRVYDPITIRLVQTLHMAP